MSETDMPANDGTTPMDEHKILECVNHIRAAAKICEEAGSLAQWATLLGVSDQLLATIDVASDHN